MSESKQFTIRRNLFTFLGAKFQIFDANGDFVAVSKQKAFKLKEDIRLYRDEEMKQELLTIKARSIIDFSAAYDVFKSAGGEKIGALKREGFKSMLRDEWVVMDPEDNEIGRLKEDSMGMALLRRFLPIIPQKFSLSDNSGAELATFQTHFNPFVHKMTLTVSPGGGMSNHLVMATGLLLMAIEGRQK